MNEVVVPELVRRVLDQLDERDEQAPRMRTIHDETFEENARDLFLEGNFN